MLTRNYDGPAVTSRANWYLRNLLRPDPNDHHGQCTKGDEQNEEEETIIKKCGALFVIHIVTTG